MKITQDTNVVDRQLALTIEMEQPELEKYLDRAYKRLSQRLVVPGFRRGKTPRWMIEKLVGREGLLDESLEFLLPEATEKAMKQENIAWSAPPSVDVAQRDPVVLKATVPLEPTIELGDYKALRIPRETVAVDDAQVQKALESLRKEQAPWEPAERPVQADDLLVIDLAGSIENKPFFKQDNMPYIVSIDSDVPLPGFANALVGLKHNQASEFDLPIPTDYPDTNVAGKMCHLIIKVQSVKQQILPELNDEFAKGVAQGFESLDALREQIKKNITAATVDNQRRTYEDKVIHAAIELSKLKIPPLLISHDVRHLLEDQMQAMARQGVKFSDYLTQSGKSVEDFQQELAASAMDRLQHTLLLRKIAEAEGIEVSEEEAKKEMATLSLQVAAESGGRSSISDTDQSREAVTRIIRSRKALERLLAIAQEPSDQAPAAEPTT